MWTIFQPWFGDVVRRCHVRGDGEKRLSTVRRRRGQMVFTRHQLAFTAPTMDAGVGAVDLRRARWVGGWVNPCWASNDGCRRLRTSGRGSRLTAPTGSRLTHWSVLSSHDMPARRFPPPLSLVLISTHVTRLIYGNGRPVFTKKKMKRVRVNRQKGSSR